ncbi:1448_t:CDS:2 [Acaulospora morrowiae]|uniref:1448_t:CDS:1 n=1 Tax=Acaulospora morrowiae TaxID=94023 RepID=A0A9N9H0Z0_9GLOM|nr:1448_t:CDS:2 [Acaulospora morrowiae]
MSQETTNARPKQKSGISGFFRILKGLSRKIKKQKPICQIEGCRNPCAKRKDVYCSINCATKGLTAHQTSTSTSIISTVPSEGDVSCSSSLNVPSKFPFSSNHASTSQNSINSRASGITYDSAYGTSLTLDTEIEETSRKHGSKGKSHKTIMKRLKPDDKEYINIASLFRKTQTYTEIEGIIRLQMPVSIVDSHMKYKKRIARENFLNEEIVTHRMFHGTKTRKGCNPERFLKNNHEKNQSFCKSYCGGCGIAQAGNQTKFSRYTNRMWFANDPSVSIGYCDPFGKKKIMFVVSVVSPRSDSILIVDKDEATLPEYMVILK